MRDVKELDFYTPNIADSLCVINEESISVIKKYRSIALITRTLSQSISFDGKKKYSRKNLQEYTFEIALIAASFINACSSYKSVNASIFIVELATKLISEKINFEKAVIESIGECIDFAESI